jgi:hypothetical protein
MIFTRDDMRATILGKMSWSRCLQCGGTGWENWSENGDDIRSGLSNQSDRCNGECENCEGLGYVRGYK